MFAEEMVRFFYAEKGWKHDHSTSAVYVNCDKKIPFKILQMKKLLKIKILKGLCFPLDAQGLVNHVLTPRTIKDISSSYQGGAEYISVCHIFRDGYFFSFHSTIPSYATTNFPNLVLIL